MCGVNEGVRQRWAGWRGGDGGRRIERWYTRWLSAATLSVSRAQYTLTCILTEYHDDRVSRMVGLGVEARGLKMCLTAVTKFAKKWVHFSNVHTGCAENLIVWRTGGPHRGIEMKCLVFGLSVSLEEGESVVSSCMRMMGVS